MASFKILYICIAQKNEIILAEYQEGYSSYSQLVKIICNKSSNVNQPKSYTVKQFEVHTQNENGFIILLVTNQGFKERIAFACINDIKNIFLNETTQIERMKGTAYSLNNKLKGTLKQKLEFYNDTKNDKLTNLGQNLQQTEEIMKENLDKLAERGDSLDQIQSKTESIVMISTDMKSNATSIKRQMWWRNKKMMVIAICVIILLIYIILLISCGGFKMSKC